MRVLGIDPGSAATGFGIIETDGGRLRAVTYGAIAPAGRLPLPQRLHRIFAALQEVVRQNTPDCVAVENPFFARNARSALILGQARGVAVLAAVAAGLEIFEYTPREIKGVVTGYGGAEKRQVQRMVATVLGLEEPVRPMDAVDALAVAICHHHLGRLRPVLGRRR